MSQIFIVTGQSGSYDSESKWNVIAFHTLDNAMNWMKKAQNRANEIVREYNRFYTSVDVKKDPEGYAAYLKNRTNEYDPGMSIDRDGVEYDIESLEVI